MWHAIRNRCWTADRLQNMGLVHPAHCPLCDQEDETAQHILTSCVFAWQFWFSILQPLNLSTLAPTRHTISIAEWWKKSWRKVPRLLRMGFNSLVILWAKILWKHRKSCMFNGSASSIKQSLQSFKDESHSWIVGGAKGFAALGLVRVS